MQIPECLYQRLRRLEQIFSDAVWEERPDEEIKKLKEQLETTKDKISMGETHDWEF
jgi:hypothetical protein